MCSKIGYPTKSAAKTALRSTQTAIGKNAPQYMKNQVRKRRQETRTYKCDECTLWHLTSIPLDQWKGSSHA